jgi:hypothetical protein
MDDEPIATRATALMETAIDGDLVALDVERGTCFGFNATATRIWTLLETPQTVSALVETLGREFAVDRDRCRAEVEALLRQLQGQGLITLS